MPDFNGREISVNAGTLLAIDIKVGNSRTAESVLNIWDFEMRDSRNKYPYVDSMSDVSLAWTVPASATRVAHMVFQVPTTARSLTLYVAQAPITVDLPQLAKR
jgi:hypothetical protein